MARSQHLPVWPHAVAVAIALVALGYATGRVRAPATPPEPGVVLPERSPLSTRSAPPAAPEPHVNVPIFELRAIGNPLLLEWPSQSALATFVLSAETKPDDEYGLRVRGHDGALVMSAEGLKRTRAGALTISMPRRMMSPGRYVFELVVPGAKPDAAPILRYEVEVTGR